jgi:hypothetical protein
MTTFVSNRRLDGNALAGRWRELVAVDLSAALALARRDARHVLGEQHL